MLFRSNLPHRRMSVCPRRSLVEVSSDLPAPSISGGGSARGAGSAPFSSRSQLANGGGSALAGSARRICMHRSPVNPCPDPAAHSSRSRLLPSGPAHVALPSRSCSGSCHSVVAVQILSRNCSGSQLPSRSRHRPDLVSGSCFGSCFGFYRISWSPGQS